MIRHVLFPFVIVCTGFLSFGQLDHYASQNFNTASAMLSGSVVGGEAEISSIFYNPAQISSQAASNFAITASLAKYERYRLRNAVGGDIDLKRDLIKVIPKFISYTNSRNENVDFEVAIFTRNENEVFFFKDVSQSIDILSQPDGEEFYNGELQYKTRYTDKWIAGGLSRKISDKFKIGLGNYLSIKSLRNEYEISVSAFPQEDVVIIDGEPQPFYQASTTDRSLLRIWNLRALWKLGIQYDIGRWGLGLTITTPSVYLFGEAWNKRELSRTNIYNPGDGERVTDIALAEYEEKVRGDLKDPFSTAIGIHFQTKDRKSSLLFTAEYFARIKEHRIVQGDDNNLQATPSVIDALGGTVTDLTREANSVFNISLGYRKYIKNTLSFMGGFRTDYSSAASDFSGESDPYVNRIPYDLFHLTGGSAFVLAKKLEVLAGLQFSWGDLTELPQLANFADPVEYNPVSGRSLQGELLPTMDVNYFAVSIFFGFTYDLFPGNREDNEND